MFSKQYKPDSMNSVEGWLSFEYDSEFHPLDNIDVYYCQEQRYV